MAEVNPLEVQKALEGQDYPASKEELVQHARENLAPEEVVDFLERIDEGLYEDPTDVQAELGRMEEGLEDTPEAA